MWLMILPMADVTDTQGLLHCKHIRQYKSVVTIRKRTKNVICADEKSILFYIICVFLPFSVLISMNILTIP